jgi:hypothetical protein
MTSTLDKIKASAKDLQSPDPVLRGKAEEIKRRYQLGMFNTELEKEGAKPVPIKKPNFEAVDMTKAMEGMSDGSPMSTIPTPKPTLGQTAKEMGGDVLETAQKIGSTISKGAENIQNIAGNKDLNIAQKSMGILGSLMGTGASTIGDVTTGVGKVALTQDAEDQLKSFVQEKAGKIAETDAAKWAVDFYSNLSPENKLIVDSAGGFVALVSEIVGAGTASKVATPLKEGLETAVETGIDVTKKGIKASGKLADKVSEASKASRIANQETKVNDAVGRIIQGSPDDIAKAKKALSEVDTEGVKTYEELNTRMDEALDTLRKNVDAELEADPTLYTKFKLARKNEVKGVDGKVKTVYDNPAISAIDELEAYYTKIGDVAGKTKMAQYRQMLDGEGLRLKDVNELARMHGKDLNAFNANGELASGLTKQAAENTRKGLKDTVRQNMPNDKTKAMDESMSNILATKDLTVKMEDKVQKLYQKIKNRTLAQKVGGAVADVADLATFGTLRGFVQKLLPSNVGLKTANSLDLEKELAKNLKQVEKLLEIKDEKKFTEAVAQYLEEVQPGLSTRVSSGLKNSEKDALLGKLKNIASSDMTADTPTRTSSTGFLDEIDLELAQRLDELSIKAEKAGGLSEREYAELKVLMDEVELNTNQTIRP